MSGKTIKRLVNLIRALQGLDHVCVGYTNDSNGTRAKLIEVHNILAGFRKNGGRPGQYPNGPEEVQQVDNAIQKNMFLNQNNDAMIQLLNTMRETIDTMVRTSERMLKIYGEERRSRPTTRQTVTRPIPPIPQQEEEDPFRGTPRDDTPDVPPRRRFADFSGETGAIGDSYRRVNDTAWQFSQDTDDENLPRGGF